MRTEHRDIVSILIVGDTLAAHLAAAALAHCLADRKRLRVVLTGEGPAQAVAAQTVAAQTGAVGVGPALRDFLQAIGVHEFAFLRGAGASFCHGWDVAGGGDDPFRAFLPFERPAAYGLSDLGEYWREGVDPFQRSFADAVSLQPGLARRLKAPRASAEPFYGGPFPYGYHVDAAKLSALLAGVATARGVAYERRSSADAMTGAEDADLVIDCRPREDAFTNAAPGAGLTMETMIPAPFARREDFKPYAAIALQDAACIVEMDSPTGRWLSLAAPDGPVARHVAVLSEFAGRRLDAGAATQVRRRTGYCNAPWSENHLRLGPAAAAFAIPRLLDTSIVVATLRALLRLAPDYFRGDRAAPANFNRACAEAFAEATAFTAALLNAAAPDGDHAMRAGILDIPHQDYLRYGGVSAPTPQRQLEAAAVFETTQLFEQRRDAFLAAGRTLPDHVDFLRAALDAAPADAASPPPVEASRP